MSTSPPLTWLTTTKSRNQSDDRIPNSQVANAGVRCRASTSPNFGGKARCSAIESAVRAAGRIVVWQLAADDVSTAMISSLSATLPNPESPNTTCPVADSTSLSWFVRYAAPLTD